MQRFFHASYSHRFHLLFALIFTLGFVTMMVRNGFSAFTLVAILMVDASLAYRFIRWKQGTPG